MARKPEPHKKRSSVEKVFTPFEREVRRQTEIFGSKYIGERVATAIYYLKKRSMSK